MVGSIVAAALLVIAAIGVGITVFALSGGNSSSSDSGSATAAPPGTNLPGTPTVVTGDAFRITAAAPGTTPRVVVHLYEDFQCPACRAFEEQFGSVLAQLADDPAVALDYQPISILDRQSSTAYSTRAANASVCVAQASSFGGNLDTWLRFHNLLFANQPDEGGAGLTDAQLVAYASQAGATGVDACITDQQYSPWVTRTTQEAVSSGVAGTPTVLINDRTYSLTTPSALIEAVRQAAG